MIVIRQRGYMYIVSVFITLLLCINISVHVQAANQCPNDRDCDGIEDYQEDLNHNGQLDVYLGETDPDNPDSDYDGLLDGEERFLNGHVADVLMQHQMQLSYAKRLDPMNSDSDGDCIPDGVELGVSKNRINEILEMYDDKPKYEFSHQCKYLLELNHISDFDSELSLNSAIIYNDDGNALIYSSNQHELHVNISMLFDMDPSTITDPTNNDTDIDGINDGLEDINLSGHRDMHEHDAENNNQRWLESDPLIMDSDGDGLRDGDEGDRNHNGILEKSESSFLLADTDFDGVSDFDENRLGLFPNACDTDEDGLSDGIETGMIQPNVIKNCHGLMAVGSNFMQLAQLDPKNPDSDGDGLRDGDEDSNHNGWLDPLETDPSSSDTDGDALDDGVEMMLDNNNDGFMDFNLEDVKGNRGCLTPEILTDIDCDGIPNARDMDSDNDGCSDMDEGGWQDANGDLVPDVYDPQYKICQEAMPRQSVASDKNVDHAINDDEQSQQFAGRSFGYGDGAACQLSAMNIFYKNYSIVCYYMLLTVLCLFFQKK